jgi:2-dehydro-3-deoxygalactonokinase
MRWTEGFIAVDWGTTNRRAYLIDSAGKEAGEFEDAKGVLSIPPGGFPEAVGEIRMKLGDKPLLLAGMVGSNRGWKEAPYVPCPAGIDELVAKLAWTGDREAIVPGVSYIGDGRADVMRGEEVQLLGAHRLRPAPLYVFPGTHSKWVPVEGPSVRAQVRTFSTMMTGELHAWLVQGSLICRGIGESPAWDDDAFARGVHRATHGADVDFVVEVFRTRARWLLADLAPAAAPSFLSGLLIGHELATMTRRYQTDSPLVVVGAERLAALYAKAAAALSISTTVLSDEDATVEGFRRISDGR